MIGRSLFTLVIAMGLAFAVLTAWSWPVRASIIVVTLGGAGLALALIQLIFDLMPVRPGPSAGGGTVLDTPQVESNSRWGILEIWGWIVGLFLAIHIVGFMAAAALFTFAYARVYGARWRLAFALGALAWGFLYGIFEKILHVPWPESLLNMFL